MPLNFVKFLRGSAAAYNALKTATPTGIDQNTLYFIYDSEAHDEGGLLYLGDILIGGVGAGGASLLNDLSDVDVSSSLLDGMILQYNSNRQTWIPIDPSELLPIVSAGTKNANETPEQALARVDATPLEGDIVFISNVPYIYNGSSWQLLVGEDLEGRVSALESGLQAVDGKIATAVATAVANSNHLSYEVVQQLPTVANASNNVVYLVSNGLQTGDNLYDEYMLIGGNLNGHLEKVGGFTANLNNYVTVSNFNSTVADLLDSISNLNNSLIDYVTVEQYGTEIGDIADLKTATGDNNITVIDEIINIDRRLVWNELDTLEEQP